MMILIMQGFEVQCDLEDSESETDEVRKNSCSICWDDFQEENPIAACANCGIKVHRDCYGLKEADCSQFTCARCRNVATPEKSIVCFMLEAQYLFTALQLCIVLRQTTPKSWCAQKDCREQLGSRRLCNLDPSCQVWRRYNHGASRRHWSYSTNRLECLCEFKYRSLISGRSARFAMEQRVSQCNVASAVALQSFTQAALLHTKILFLPWTCFVETIPAINRLLTVLHTLASGNTRRIHSKIWKRKSDNLIS